MVVTQVLLVVSIWYKIGFEEIITSYDYDHQWYPVGSKPVFRVIQVKLKLPSCNKEGTTQQCYLIKVPGVCQIVTVRTVRWIVYTLMALNIMLTFCKYNPAYLKFQTTVYKKYF